MTPDEKFLYPFLPPYELYLYLYNDSLDFNDTTYDRSRYCPCRPNVRPFSRIVIFLVNFTLYFDYLATITGYRQRVDWFATLRSDPSNHTPFTIPSLIEKHLFISCSLDISILEPSYIKQEISVPRSVPLKALYVSGPFRVLPPCHTAHTAPSLS